MAAAYYNEIDPFAAAWLRELIKANLIAPGEVDERSIEDVEPSDLKRFTQCHFFAGIGVWSHALRAAGWSDDSPVWTGSCPCQSFSASGKRGGFSDKRHLWPAWFRLISQCRPHTIFGEQVASKDGLAWLDVVSADLEREGYAIGAADICAAGFGGPHIRQRLYFVGDAADSRRERDVVGQVQRERERPREHVRVTGPSPIIGVADSERTGREGRLLGWPDEERRIEHGHDGRGGAVGVGRGPTNGFWRDVEWLYCRDEKFRPTKPGTAVLASGVTNRVGKLRGYGNALCAPVAQGFIESYLDVKNAA